MKRSRFNPVTMIAVTLLSAVFLMFQNCQRPVQLSDRHPSNALAPSSQSASSLSEKRFETPLQAATEPFENGKIQILVPPEGQSKALNKTNTVGLPLIVVMNNQCADANPNAPLTKQIDRSENLKLQVQAYDWILPSHMSLDHLAALADSDPCVIGISQDEEVYLTSANDPQISNQTNFLTIGGQETFDFFNDPIRGSTNSVLVAVIDSGIKQTHPDLQNMLWTGSGNIHGVNFINSNRSIDDDNGHGTAVSGILAAQANNGVGIAGVMGHNIEIMSLKVINSEGNSTIDLMIDAIQYAVSENVDVINISMEGANANASLKAVLQSAVTSGSVIVVAAGNGAVPINPNSNTIVPALYSSGIGGMISVGSVDATSGNKSSFSNYGPNYIEIAAPGSGGVRYPNISNGYSTGTGTSYAAPAVSGAAALTISFLKKNGIAYSPADIENILLVSSLKKTSLSTYFRDGNTLDLRSLSQFLKRQYLTLVEGGFDEN